MGGCACIRGMRIPVSVIVSQIAHGETIDDMLVGCPDLERQDVQQAIEYAAWLAQGEVQRSQDGDMRLLADACIDVRGAKWLRGFGHDVFHLRDQGLQRLPDAERAAVVIVDESHYRIRLLPIGRTDDPE